MTLVLVTSLATCTTSTAIRADGAARTTPGGRRTLFDRRVSPTVCQGCLPLRGNSHDKLATRSLLHASALLPALGAATGIGRFQGRRPSGCS